MTHFYQTPEFLQRMIDIIKDANVILRNERTQEMQIDIKTDSNGRKSKVTSGDIKSNDFIMEKLRKINAELEEQHIGHYNIISEEIAEEPYETRNSSHIAGSWCVDPLDGTADYCNLELKNPSYTCNIGLIVDGDPVFGIFSVPESGVIYYGIRDIGSFKINDEMSITYDETGCRFPGLKLEIPKKDLTKSGIRVAVSASHMNHDTKGFIDQHLNDVFCVQFASSLKLGAVADGTVDIYPRCGPTCEWDTCAADAVVRYAGGGVYIYDPNVPPSQYTRMLKYNKPNLHNPYFVVY